MIPLGIAVLDNKSITILKDMGRVKHLEELIKNDTSPASVGIAHTRWATHGKPSKENAHPHLDNSHSFAVVHNGIIENYMPLKSFLEEKGYNFLSQTDTEVIPNLIHYYYTQNNNILQAVHQTCQKLIGSYAIAVIYKNECDKIIVAKKDSPLVLGKGQNENYISSDIPAVLSYTKDFYFLNDKEYAEVYKDKIEFYDANLKPISKELTKISWDADAAQKDGYEDFMLKEIYEQSRAIRDTLSISDFPLSSSDLQNISKIYLVACGTAMHAGLIAKPLLEQLCQIPAEVDIASEFRYRNPIIDEHTLAIFISQSGETADTLAALKLAKEKGAKTIAISNVVGSSIPREADYALYTKAGPEIAVASTKAYTAQVALLTKLAIYFAEQLNSYSLEELDKLKKDLLKLPIQIEQILEHADSLKKIAKIIYTESDIYYIGRGLDYYVCLEGSLKLKEISYIHSEAYASGELKHGTIALIENGTTVVSVITNPLLKEKSISNIQEVITRGAKAIVITNQDVSSCNFDYVISIPSVSPLLAPIISVIPLQLLAYYVAKEKHLDVDKPRNLAKSVTVE